MSSRLLWLVGIPAESGISWSRLDASRADWMELMLHVCAQPSGEDLPVCCVVGIDVGSQSCSCCVLKPDKSIVMKATTFANTTAGFALLEEHLAGLQVPAQQMLIGLEATSRSGEHLYQFLAHQGSHLCLLHPAQTHQFAKRRGLRAKTDKLDAITIAHVLLSAEARYGYVRSRTHCLLSGTGARAQPTER